MRETSCGVLLFQERPRRSFLLLVRGDGFDLPKGRIKRGEDELQCALRELEEETGIMPSTISLIEGFRFETTYSPNKHTKKTVVLFAAEVLGPCAVVTPDHDDYCWMPWRPPHDYSDFPTIHGGLRAWQKHLDRPASRARRAS